MVVSSAATVSCRPPYIPVRDVALVQVADGGNDLADDGARLGLGEHLLCDDAVKELAALQQLHHHQQPALGRLGVCRTQ